MRKTCYFPGLLLVASLFPWCSPVKAETVDKEVSFETKTSLGHEVSLHFPEDQLSTRIKTAVVCRTPAAVLTSAKLWMPDMGHGTSPTFLVPLNDHCTRVERVHFLMEGQWEMRLSFEDGDSGIFLFDVPE